MAIKLVIIRRISKKRILCNYWSDHVERMGEMRTDKAAQLESLRVDASRETCAWLKG
jgi:hypothetical protein